MTLKMPDSFGIKACNTALKYIEKQIRELRGDEVDKYKRVHVYFYQDKHGNWQSREDEIIIQKPVMDEECPHDWENAINGRCPWCKERKNGH